MNLWVNPTQPIRTSTSNRWQLFWGLPNNQTIISHSLKFRRLRATEYSHILRWCRVWPSSRTLRTWIQQICSIRKSSWETAARTLMVLQTHTMKNALTMPIWSNLIQTLIHTQPKAKNELQSRTLKDFNIGNSSPKYLVRTRKSSRSSAQACTAWPQNPERKIATPLRRKF